MSSPEPARPPRVDRDEAWTRVMLLLMLVVTVVAVGGLLADLGAWWQTPAPAAGGIYPTLV